MLVLNLTKCKYSRLFTLIVILIVNRIVNQNQVGSEIFFGTLPIYGVFPSTYFFVDFLFLIFEDPSPKFFHAQVLFE
jgi:hypothetical protein